MDSQENSTKLFLMGVYLFFFWHIADFGRPRWFSGKESVCQADVGLIPGLGRSPGEGIGNQLQHSCLGNPMDRGAWWAPVHGLSKS